MKTLFLLCSNLLYIILAHATVNVQTNPDGTHATAVLVNGSTTLKYDIVFVGDGFTSSTADQDKFNNAVLAALDALRHKAPYSTNICAFNVWRVNVISAESGIDHPITGVSKNTELNCTFGDDVGTPERVIYSTTPDRVTEAANYAPAFDAIYVLVNDAQYGGAAGSIVYTSLNSSMQEVIVHELGHFVGHLADEYNCYFCNGGAEPPYSGPEPGSVNLTINLNPATLKWKNFVASTTPLPTTVDTPPGVVGAWAGGGYSPTGIYRPQNNCLMKALNSELCVVCSHALNGILQPNCTACERDPSSLACAISKLRKRVFVYKPKIFRIPECCFCPLLTDLRQQVEIVLSVDNKKFQIQVLTAEGKKIQTTVRDTDQGTMISFEENIKQAYLLQITPNTALKEAVPVDISINRNGQAVPL